MKRAGLVERCFHAVSLAVVLILSVLQLAGFILQNPYQIPSPWLRLGLVAALFFAGYRAAFHSLLIFFLLIPISGFAHLRLGVENTILETLFCGLYIGWAARQVFCRHWIVREAPAAIFCSHGLILIVFSSLFSLLHFFSPEFLIYRCLYTQPLDQLDPLFSYRAGLTLIFALALFEMAWREGEDRLSNSRVFAWLAAQAAIVLIFAGLQLFFQYPAIRLPGLFSPFADIHSFAGYALFLFMFFFYVAMKPDFFLPDRPRPGVRVLSSCLAIAFLVCIVLSNSRSSWLIAAAACAVAWLSRLGRRRALTRFVVGAACLVILGTAFQSATTDYGDTLTTSMRHNIVVRIRNLIDLPGQLLRQRDQGEVQTLTGRVRLWERAWELARRDPITGIGVGSFYRNSAPDNIRPDARLAPGMRQNAHNWYLQMLAELGWPGFLLFLGLFWTTNSAGWRTKPGQAKEGTKPVRRALALGFIAYATSCLAGHHLILSTQQYCIFFLLAWICPQSSATGPVKRAAAVLVVLVAIVCGYNLYVGLEAKPAQDVVYGLYPRQSDDPLARRWTMRGFGLPVRIDNEVMLLEFQGEAPNIPGGRQRLRLFLNGRQIDEVVFDSSAARLLSYRTKELIGKTAFLEGELDRAFNPSAHGAGGDNRDLGALMSDVRFVPLFPGLTADSR